MDIIIFFIILSSALLGFKRGFTKEVVSYLGFFLIIIISFMLKNPISNFFYDVLPFFKFGGYFKGVTALNIILYEVLAFSLVASCLLFIFRILLFATSIFEKILKMTIILGIPSKILGMIVGILEGVTWSFIVVYILSLPFFNIKKTDMSNYFLTNTPILSTFTKDLVSAIYEVEELKIEYDKKDNKDTFNKDTIDILLKYKIVSTNSVEKLNKKGKLNIKHIDTVIDKYR